MYLNGIKNLRRFSSSEDFPNLMTKTSHADSGTFLKNVKNMSLPQDGITENHMSKCLHKRFKIYYDRQGERIKIQNKLVRFEFSS